jgi:hypothetical protein
LYLRRQSREAEKRERAAGQRAPYPHNNPNTNAGSTTPDVLLYTEIVPPRNAITAVTDCSVDVN